MLGEHSTVHNAEDDFILASFNCELDGFTKRRA